MDSFIDKFAQRKNAQEMIRANAMAEAEEREKLAAKLAEYELAIQEMRRCSLNNIENSEKVKELLTASLHKIEEIQKQDTGKPEKTAEELQALLGKLTERIAKFEEEHHRQMSEILEKQQSLINEFSEQQTARSKELLDAQTKMIEELIHASDEFDHKEAVKVYRNVQAVIEEALPKQTQEIAVAVKNTEESKKIPAGMIILWVLTFAAAAAGVAIDVLKILGYL